MTAWPQRGAAALALLLAACGGGSSPGGGAGLAGVADGVCQAAAQAGGGDVEQARATFYDRSHDGLHDVAGRLDSVDRTLAARLLEAKQRVESGLDRRPPPASVVADLVALDSVTRDALDRLSVDTRPCP